MQETANSNYVFEQFFVLKNFTTGVWVIFGIAGVTRLLQIPLIRKLTPYIPYISTPAAHSGKICPFLQRTPI